MDDLRDIELGDGPGVDEPPVAQDADLVGQLDDFLQSMRNVNDGQALEAKLTDDLEQPDGLPLAQRRGRFVHDDDGGLATQRLEDLDDLAVTGGQVLHPCRRIEVELVLFSQPTGLGGHLLVADRPGQRAFRLGPEKDVLGYRQMLGQVQLLVDHRDARFDCLSGIGQRPWLPVNLDGPGIGLIHPGHDLHERGFARPVFPDQGVNDAGPRQEADVTEGLHRPKALRDSLHAQGDAVGGSGL